MFWIDYKHRPASQHDAVCIHFVTIQHIEFHSQLSFCIINDWVWEFGALIHICIGLDIWNPFQMRFNRINRQCDRFNVAFLKFWVQLNDTSQFSRAHWCKIGRMWKQNCPSTRKWNNEICELPFEWINLRFTKPIIEINFANRCVGCKIWKSITNIHDQFKERLDSDQLIMIFCVQFLSSNWCDNKISYVYVL